MRGGITMSDAYFLSFEDRQIASEVIQENIETTKKTGLPFF